MPRDGAQEAMLKKQLYVDNLTTSTWYDVRKQLFGDIFQVTPLLDKMIEKGRVKERVPDGSHFEIPIQYGKLSQNQKWFGRGDTFGEKEAEFIIYEHKGKRWVYKVSGEPVKFDDVNKLIYHNCIKSD